MKRAIAASLILAALGYAQSGPTFEVATIKPADLTALRTTVAGSATPVRANVETPDRITKNITSLNDLLQLAYGVKGYQISGPAWLGTERFDIIAKIPEGATKEQINLMWQNLLAERFGVKLHHETREFPVDELVIAKGGHKLKPTTLAPDAPPATPGTRLDFATGILPGPGLVTAISLRNNGNGVATAVVGKLMARAQTIEALATNLSNQLKHPVVDKTGLTGKYDFTVEFMPEGINLPPLPAGAPTQSGPTAEPPAVAEPGLTLTAAVQQQLGLRLVGGKAPLDFIVVDKAEKVPTEN